MIANGTNAAEKLVETTRGAYRTPMSWAVALREPYTKLAWGLLERSRKQQEAFRALLNESLEVYIDLLYATVPSPRKEPRTINEEPELPIEDYDRLTVKEVIGKLDGLGPDEVERLKTYEKNNKNRVTLIKWFDRGPV